MIKVHIEQENFGLQTNLYVFETNPDGEIKAVAEPVNNLGSLTMRRIESGEKFDPTIRMGDVYGRQFLTSLAKELRRLGFIGAEEDRGVKELAATKYHLEDLRALLKLKSFLVRGAK